MSSVTFEERADSAQFWLLGYEFPTTLMLFTTETLYILTTTKKGAPRSETIRRDEIVLTAPS